MKPVADAVVDATLPLLSRHVRAMVEVQRLTGARPGEVCSMRTCDLVMVGKVWEYRPARHKSMHHGRGRVVFVGPAAQDVLRSFLGPNLDEPLLLGPARTTLSRLARVAGTRWAIEGAFEQASRTPAWPITRCGAGPAGTVT